MITHLVVGDDCWDPTPEELKEILYRFHSTPFANGDVRGVEIGKLEGPLLEVEVDLDLNLTKEQIQELVDMFQQATLDPKGGVIVTRNGIKFLTEEE